MNGPRHNKRQSSNQRKAINNGIWLCRECGDIVDKDISPHSAPELRRWKRNHEAMIKEVRTEGYSKSLELLRSTRAEPQLAKRIINILEDRRALWETFDYEFPNRVRHSLDTLRVQLIDLRSQIPDQSPLDQILLSLTKTIHVFFRSVEKSDLERLRCDSSSKEWLNFRDALLELRKSIGFQIDGLAKAYKVSINTDLQKIVPQH